MQQNLLVMSIVWSSNHNFQYVSALATTTIIIRKLLNWSGAGNMTHIKFNNVYRTIILLLTICWVNVFIVLKFFKRCFKEISWIHWLQSVPHLWPCHSWCRPHPAHKLIFSLSLSTEYLVCSSKTWWNWHFFWCSECFSNKKRKEKKTIICFNSTNVLNVFKVTSLRNTK